MKPETMDDLVPLADASAVARSIFPLKKKSPTKPLITNFDSGGITRLRTHHNKGMKIHPAETRSCIQCTCCIQKSKAYLRVSFPRALKLRLIPFIDPLQEILYSQDLRI
ncbi:hypothetical protein TNCV_1913811 [Trichonephila clavipes]|nr:hypothetical protein TNCV_1913811 [Trichonephila clavipes]